MFVNLNTLLTLLLVTLNIVACSDIERQSSPPNIIFLLTDDQRFDMLGINGNEVIQTPNIDQLGRDGTNFTNHYVTTSICSVSRASILSGQYGRRHELWGFGSGFSEQAFADTYPMKLQENGYYTGFIGKYGVGPINLPSANFDYWNGFGGQGQYAAVDKNGQTIHLTRKIGSQMLDFIDRVPEEQPFCLSVSFKAPHVQDGAPIGNIFPFDRSYVDFYEDENWIKPDAASAEYDEHFPTEIFTEDNVARKRFERRFSDEEKYDRSLEGYYRLVHGIDVQVGHLIAKLDSAGLADNTIIIFTSDNGFYLGEYGFAGKWYGSEPSIRTPMIIYDPRNKRSSSVDALTLNIDIAPTILSLAGINAPTSYQGQSLTVILDGSVTQLRSSFFYEHLWPITPGYPIPSTEGVVTKDGKLMKYFEGIEHNATLFTELYDLSADPHELINLSGRDENSSLETELEAEFMKVKDAAN